MKIAILLTLILLVVLSGLAQSQITSGETKIISREYIDRMISHFPNEEYSKIHIALACNWLPTEPVKLTGYYMPPNAAEPKQMIERSVNFSDTTKSYYEVSGQYIVVNIAVSDRQDASGNELRKVHVDYMVNERKSCPDAFGRHNFTR